jgi:hypothetical protein
VKQGVGIEEGLAEAMLLDPAPQLDILYDLEPEWFQTADTVQCPSTKKVKCPSSHMTFRPWIFDTTELLPDGKKKAKYRGHNAFTESLHFRAWENHEMIRPEAINMQHCPMQYIGFEDHIPIGKEHPFPGCRLQPSLECVWFSQPSVGKALDMDHLQSTILLSDLGKNFTRLIRRAVVYRDHLKRGIALGQEGSDSLLYSILLITGRNHYGERRQGGIIGLYILQEPWGVSTAKRP